MQQKLEQKTKLEELTVAELQAVNGGGSWLGYLSRINDHQMGLQYGYQTGGSSWFPTCDRIL
ncbi:hypothetical protein [Shewanella sp. MBTL60-007]|uniref:hypothetical protein n=1 Tax=Shewanella sp. MBTL60-007 TaxID=2815911 RepID=UPI001BBFAD6A|nr:hypothetical protein [Shewanella sp. MBTL60-007]GIU27398.1 hypothetical protein TUM3792_35120 [Shewanella sp. MBTL60-007]